jgi:class II lanthipeptide synthase
VTPSAEKFLPTAGRIAARLCRDAVWADARCNWLGASIELLGNAWTITHRAAGPDLYSGTSGIALFLSEMFARTGERLYRLTARGGISQALSRLAGLSPQTGIGFYTGLTGIAYATVAIGENLGDQQLIDRGLAIAESLAGGDLSQQELDVLAGVAGAITPLVSIYHRYRRDCLLDFAIRCGKRLIRTARRSDLGWSWPSLQAAAAEPQRDLTGFSHGAAGIAWALHEIYRETGGARFRQAAEAAFHYERHWFNEKEGNWEDLRPRPGSGVPGMREPVYGLAWCHGAPGIALSRLRAYAISGHPAWKAEAGVALETTARTLRDFLERGQGNFSLCHGLSGNAEALIDGYLVLGEEAYRSLAEAVGEQGIELYAKNNDPWPCGVHGGGETPNLMLGLAGIGHFYLRLHDPARTSSVLMVSPAGDARTQIPERPSGHAAGA